MPRTDFERRELSDELRRLFDLLDGEAQARGSASECSPPMDVTESATEIEIAVDVPGVQKDQIQIVFARGTVVIAGTKQPRACGDQAATFHLAERAFGRFARIVRIAGAIDAGRARATLRGGELRVTVPRIDERRGREVRIPIETD